MRRRSVLWVLVCMAFFASAALGAGDLKDPKQIIAKSKEKTLSYDSYSFTFIKQGWDFEMEKTAEQTKALSGEASKSVLTKKFTGDVDKVDTKAKYMKYNCDVKFKKPYLESMYIRQSDYLPSVLQQSTMTYRPDKDDKVFWVKAKYMPMGIKRGTETTSGNFFYSTMPMNYMKIDSLMKNIKPVLAEIEKVAGKDAYKIVFDFPKGKEIKTDPVNYDAWGIPKPVQWRFKDEIDEYSRGNISKVIYYFDVETLNMVQSDCLQANGKEYFHKEWKNWKVNNLKESDF